MRKNVAGQIIGGQMVSKTDGSPVTTGNTTVYVTGDGGTMTVGSVLSGLCTHEGNGYWTYTPSAAETNYTQIGWTFVNAAAITATVQVYTTTTLGPTTASSATTTTTRQLTTFRDLYLDLQNRVRVTTGSSATESQAKRYINIALHDAHLGFDYKLPWCERQSTLLTHAPYVTGTASITMGTTTLTGASTLWNTANDYAMTNMRAGGKVTIAGTTDIYKVSAITSDTVATLATRYIASAHAVDTTYRYFEDEYALADDFLRPVDLQQFTNAWSIPIISRTEFRRRYPRPNIIGRPVIACLVDEGFHGSTTPVRKIQFYPSPDTTYIIPYAYVTTAIGVDVAGLNLTSLVEDDDEPIMPLRYRHAIVLHALANWYRDKRDDARSQEVKAEYTDIMTRIVSDHDIGTHCKAQIQPVGGRYWRYARNPYGRRGGRRYDLNDRFDSMTD